MQNQRASFSRRIIQGLFLMATATMLWLPFMHLFFQRDTAAYFDLNRVPPKAELLLERHLRLWERHRGRNHELAKMRKTNPEWDFMSRTFLVGALANLALRDSNRKKRALLFMDRIIEDTLRLEKNRGMHYFLLPYSRRGPFKGKIKGNQFLDGEIAFMLAARRMVAEKNSYRPLLRERVRRIIARMNESPVLSAESYPNESWIFCNTFALAAIRMHDYLDNGDHSPFFRRWLKSAQANLTEKTTGLLKSSFTFRGSTLDGPEGSTIWLAAHMLQVIDAKFAEKQYRLARKILGRNFLGFGYAAEWPPGLRGPGDVDSGLVVPILDAGPGASGQAFIGAAAFKDKTYFTALMTSLDFAAFPIHENQTLKYGASNLLGDTVLLYAMLQGPLWKKLGVRDTKAANATATYHAKPLKNSFPRQIR